MTAATDEEIQRCIRDIKDIALVLDPDGAKWAKETKQRRITETEMVKCMRKEWKTAALRVMREEKTDDVQTGS